LAISLARKRRNSVNSGFGPKSAVTIVFSDRDFLYGEQNFGDMLAVKRLLDIFSLHMHRNGYLGASGQKSDPAIRSGDLDFL